MGVLYQAICTMIACYICMSTGIIFSWPSATLRLFASPNTTLHRPMDETEISLLSSLFPIGALISTPIAGWALDIVGRKNCLLSLTLAQVISWVMIAASSRVELVLTAVFISGLGGTGFLLVPVYISEVCQESIRGSMTAGSTIFYALGILLSYLLGGYLSYYVMVYVCLAVAVLGMAMITFLRETPLYLMKKGLEEDAAKSFAFYRNEDVDSKMVQEEMNALRRAFNPEMEDDDISPEEEKLQTDSTNSERDVGKETFSLWRFIKKSKSTRKAIFVGTILMTASLFQGFVVVQVLAEPIFEQAVPNMSATECSVMVAVITVVIGVVAAYLTDVAGRRPLLIYSSIATGLCCVVLGTMLQLNWGPQWLTVTFMYLYTLTYTLGAGTVPYVIICEVFLPEVKSYITMFIIEWSWLCMFIILFIFDKLVTAIGLGCVFYLFSAVCFFTATFAIFYLPETKGLPVDLIQNLFVKRRNSIQC